MSIDGRFPYEARSVIDHESEARVLDLDVAEALGFKRPSNIRNLIKRNIGELGRSGTDLLCRGATFRGR
jgi:hypothetical protein